MTDLYRLTPLGEKQAEPLDGLVEYVISEGELIELIRHTITCRKAFDTARQIGEAVADALAKKNTGEHNHGENEWYPDSCPACADKENNDG